MEGSRTTAISSFAHKIKSPANYFWLRLSLDLSHKLASTFQRGHRLVSETCSDSGSVVRRSRVVDSAGAIYALNICNSDCFCCSVSSQPAFRIALSV
jgi:hypothetical protein